ncbi:phenylacetate--CoA ligase family protein [Massilia antarctica]|uniref:Phenylacetate--CoA ligase family protein n=1 Tax=Massilia antarctica TaxID=2765360 RepID=A0AA49A7N8_9BURK|nr:phenylacetate--CoA ligase family protein [Massilia antarctica]QPI49564.1 phenylacetate--CoA ligase family protein [Massilia antarctica]
MSNDLPAWRLKSSLSGIEWPAVPDVRGSLVYSLFRQMESEQWLAPREIAARQSVQLEQVVRHAALTVPWYREHWPPGLLARLSEGGALCADAFAGLPCLSRRDLQAQFAQLQSSAVPSEHGPLSDGSSSGSTGTPVRFRKTYLNQLIWEAQTLRDHAWHQRDLQQTLCIIRRGEADQADNWGMATRMFHTGPAYLCPVEVDVQAQLAWLVERAPGYLLTYPSLALQLASLARQQGVRLPRLREVRTFGEPLDAQVRQACHEAWGVPVNDTYSSEEFGYLAIRCPHSGHYHVQSENVLLEVLDDDDKACAPGVCGRVVVTGLLNFAMPLIRYELGDMAEAGPPCPCGRGLPVLTRILGRTRNMLVTADAKRYWPTFGFRDSAAGVASGGPRIVQRQVVQTALDHVQIRYVSAGALSPAEESQLTAQVARRLPPGVGVSAQRVADIARSANGKFEEFVSAIAASPETP